MSRRITALYAALLLFNGGAWLWALAALHRFPVLIGTAALAYTFGLRHAVDADHIAAIDNVTRKLMQRGLRPIGVGAYFSLGHSTIVFALTLAIAVASAAISTHFGAWAAAGATVGTLISAAFLLGIAAANLVVLAGVYRTFRAVQAGAPYRDEDLDLLLSRRGFMGRVFRRLFGLVTRSRHMFAIGVLFGLGFDTATEIGLLGLSAQSAARGLPIWTILVFPTLFAAGMTLVDTTDGVVMLGAYRWALVDPLRKLHYNLTITLVSVVVAVLIGGLELLGLAADRLKLAGPAWREVAALNDHFGLLGLLVIAIFAVTWLISFALYRSSFRRPSAC
ncbi:MAG TPA: HoxN/HupN/NixA family nickel/cobalt transporter [Opitutaceae bacterium]|jgi:high-affinity nickel-transport protein|nr:HoxN/HupN/NixA family nickel/cobalt transporter [Opitutaceae bacterium]